MVWQSRRVLVLATGAAAIILLLPIRAGAQDNFHWARHHAVPPLSDVLPGALPTPPSPLENNRGERSGTHDLIRHDDGSFTWDEIGFTASVDGEGRATFKDKPGIRGVLVVTPLFIGVAGTFDATDMLMRWLGQDPYSYQKKAFLESTFGERSSMRMRHASRTMETAIADLPRYLDSVWRYDKWSIELRRRVLFALWDECAERGNDLMTEGGREARAVIETFMREQLPIGSPDGYTLDELQWLNGTRTSRAAFAPYTDTDTAQTVANKLEH